MQKWNDVLAILNERYNGGYVFSDIQWYRNGQTIPAQGNHNSYIYEGSNDNEKTLVFGVPYWAKLTRNGESKGICTCAYIPKRTGNDKTVFQPRVRLSRSRGMIHITSDKTGRYELYDVLGRCLQTGSVAVVEQPVPTSVTAHTGAYICVMYAEDGTQTTQKFIVP